MSVEQIWRSLEESKQLGGSLRVGEEHPSDFYGSIDFDGRPGLLLVTESLVATPLTLNAVDISIGQRGDGRKVLALWLTVKVLRPVFSLLCDDLVNATMAMDKEQVGAFVVSRLTRWRRLLEPATPSVLPIRELRGLLGELLVLQECLCIWNPHDVVLGWQGPLDAPQDFAFAGRAIEVKAIVPGATTIRINSAEQLDIDDGRRLIVAVVELAAAANLDPLDFSIVSLLADIRTQLHGDPGLDDELDRRLVAAGYVEHPDYEEMYFHCSSKRFFLVSTDFPRVTRMELRRGVVDVVYDIALAACAPHATKVDV